MKATYNNCIGVFENAFPLDMCEDLINLFNKSQDTINRKEELEKYLRRENKDENFKLNQPFNFINQNDLSLNLEDANKEYYDYVQNLVLNAICPNYVENHFRVEEFDDYVLNEVKLQKTFPSQGYHLWHFENNHRVNSPVGQRLLAYIIYLNDVEEGGETEFLFQSKRIKPKKGTILLFPAYFTHTHRGNPPLSGEKYIATGWLYAKSN